MGFHEDAAADAAEIAAEVGRPVVFRGIAFSAMIGDSQQSFDLASGGFAEAGAISVKLIAAGLYPNPADGEHIEYAGKTFRISSISRRFPSPWFELKCEPLSAR